jgi:hypothetical protein
VASLGLIPSSTKSRKIRFSLNSGEAGEEERGLSKTDFRQKENRRKEISSHDLRNHLRGECAVLYCIMAEPAKEIHPNQRVGFASERQVRSDSNLPEASGEKPESVGETPADFVATSPFVTFSRR